MYIINLKYNDYAYTLQALYIMADFHLNNLFDHLTNVHILLLMIN